MYLSNFYVDGTINIILWSIQGCFIIVDKVKPVNGSRVHFFNAISWREQVNFQWNDEIRIVLDQHTWLQQLPTDRHVTTLWHIIPIPSQPVSLMLSGEATNGNFIVFGFTRSGLESALGEHANYYTSDAVSGIMHKMTFFLSLCTIPWVFQIKAS